MIERQPTTVRVAIRRDEPNDVAELLRHAAALVDELSELGFDVRITGDVWIDAHRAPTETDDD